MHGPPETVATRSIISTHTAKTQSHHAERAAHPPVCLSERPNMSTDSRHAKTPRNREQPRALEILSVSGSRPEGGGQRSCSPWVSHRDSLSFLFMRTLTQFTDKPCVTSHERNQS